MIRGCGRFENWAGKLFLLLSRVESISSKRLSREITATVFNVF